MVLGICGIVYGILFRTAAETLTTIAADPKHLGAQLGMTWFSIPGARPCSTIRMSNSASGPKFRRRLVAGTILIFESCYGTRLNAAAFR
jgi:hypothetical protein